MMKQREWLIIGMLLIMVISAFSLNLNATVATETITGKLLRANPTHGWITLTSITTTAITHNTQFFLFTTTAGTYGFDPYAGTNVTALTMTSSSVTATLSGPGTLAIYSTNGPPTSVTGGAYSHSLFTTTVTSSAITPIVVTWTTAPGYVDPTLITGPIISGFLAIGDYIGLVFAPYTLLLGDMFGALIIFAIMLPLYNRTQSLDYCLVVWVLLSAVLTVALPLMTFRLAYVFLILGVASLLFRMLIPKG